MRDQGSPPRFSDRQAVIARLFIELCQANAAKLGCLSWRVCELLAHAGFAFPCSATDVRSYMVAYIDQQLPRFLNVLGKLNRSLPRGLNYLFRCRSRRRFRNFARSPAATDPDVSLIPLLILLIAALTAARSEILSSAFIFNTKSMRATSLA